MSPRTIAIRRGTSKARTFPELHEAGMKHVRALAGDIWTDHNTHDPGVTLLEVLSFGLSELSYRTHLPIEDLVASHGAAKGVPSGIDGSIAAPLDDFASPEDVLTCNPVTHADWRALLIDRVDGVRDLWLSTAEVLHYVDPETGDQSAAPQPGFLEYALEGIYDLLVDADPDADWDRIESHLRAEFHRHRALCEDLREIRPVEDHPFRVCVDVVLEAESDSSAIKARAFRRLEDHLHPRFARRSAAELHADGAPLDEVLEGPLLRNGVFETGALEKSELLTEVVVSDLVRLIHEVDGVIGIERIEVLDLLAAGTPRVDGTLAIAPGRRPQLALAEFNWCGFSDGFPLPVDDDRVEQIVGDRPVNTAASSGALSGPSGRVRDYQAYRPVMRDLPKAYGTTSSGFTDDGSGVRRRQVRQLQGFLLPMEQLLANYAAQLAHVPELLTADVGGSPTLYGQSIEDIEGVDELLPDDYGIPEKRWMLTLLGELGLDPPRWVAILDHLLGRLGEDFGDLAVITAHVAGLDEIAARVRWLRRVPELARIRGRGTNTTAPILDPGGLEQRLASVLSGPRFGETAELTTEFYFDHAGLLRFRIVDPDDGEILLRCTRGFRSRSEAQREYRQVLGATSDPNNFTIEQAENGRFYMTLSHTADDGARDTIGTRGAHFDTEAEVQATVDRLVALVGAFFTDHRDGASARARPLVIDKILLRPLAPGDPMLRACVDDPTLPLDPYSGQVVVLVPLAEDDIPKREYRDAIERLVRSNLPAHVWPKVCFTRRDDLAAIRPAWLDWLSGRLEGAADRLRELLDLLDDVVNPYEPRRLVTEGEPADPDQHVLLGRSRIGADPHNADDPDEPDDPDNP